MQVDVGSAAGRRPEPEPEGRPETAEVVEVAELGEFVERLADRVAQVEEVAPERAPDTAAPSEPATVAAAEQVRARIDAGEAPAGLRRLAEALAEVEEVTAPTTPAPRPTDDERPVPLTDVVAAVRA
ncbi:hypothetical protein, partial [Pseudonocardia pini]|uniref:hypothetical protein n=1 Tax=Pseudonocardia pini TaxID=2758030 RepID=UPI0035E407E6